MIVGYLKQNESLIYQNKKNLDIRDYYVKIAKV